MLPSVARLSPPIDGLKDDPLNISFMAEKRARHSKVEGLAGPGRGTSSVQLDLPTTPDSCDVGYVSNIVMLPDELLLGIFYFMCVGDDYKDVRKPTWMLLVHVCQRWRHIVFAAPHRLNLRLICMARTPVDKMLGVWPALPIVIRVIEISDNILPALEHKDRIREIYVESLTRRGSQKMGEVMQDSHPALTDLHIGSHDVVSPDLSNSFLGRSAPGLRSLHLGSVIYPALPELLLSSTGLVCLSLWDTPIGRCFSAETMVDCLASLMDLEELQIDFLHYPPGPRRHQSPPTRTVLAVLYSFSFRGHIEQLEVFCARIEAPLLNHVHLNFLDPAIFDISTISPFIGHKELFKALDQAHMAFHSSALEITLSSRNETTGGRLLVLLLFCNDSGWLLRCLTQGHRPFSLLSPLAKYHRLNNPVFKFKDRIMSPGWIFRIGNARWLELLRFFASVEDLYLSEELGIFIAPALREHVAGEGVATQVLPALKNLFIEKYRYGIIPEGKYFREFVYARKVSGRPVSLQDWE